MNDLFPSLPLNNAPAATILVVDDNPTNLKVVVEDLKDRGFRTAIATNGELALKRAQHLRPDLILLDVMMPGIDGFETCHRLKTEETTREIPVIFMTALTQIEEKVRGFEVGAVDYITKPIQHEEVFARVNTHLRIRQLTQHLQAQTLALSEANRQILSLNEQLKDENLRMKTEMALARRIQTALLPRQINDIHPDFEISAVMRPAEEVGGDYYDILLDPQQHLWFGIGDVSGHGVTPGLIMMIAQTVHATITLNFDLTPADVVALVNKMIYYNVHGRLDADHFMTFSSVKYFGDGRFQHAGAHLDMVVFRRKTGRCELIDTVGAWLNFLPDIGYATKNAEFAVEVGDILILYTDGLTESHKIDGELFDVPRFLDVIAANANENAEAMRDAIMNAALAWSEQVQEDDMTLVVARRIR